MEAKLFLFIFNLHIQLCHKLLEGLKKSVNLNAYFSLYSLKNSTPLALILIII